MERKCRFTRVEYAVTAVTFWLVSFTIIAAIGAFVGKVTGRITRTEYVAGLLAALIVVMPAVSWAGTYIAKDSALSHYEYWNGLEAAATTQTVQCDRDGSCTHTYDCDRYQEYVTKSRQVPYTRTETYTNSQGQIQTRTVTDYRTEYYEELETRYHECPYVTEEITYNVADTLGRTRTLGQSYFPADAEASRWRGAGYDRPRSGSGMPPLPSVPQGEPATWAAVKSRVDRGEPGGTTERKSYDDYILASAEDSYTVQADAIEQYRERGLMPRVVEDVTGWSADKVYFAGVTVPDAEAWQYGLQTLNGYFGAERQGDLHVVVVDSVGSSEADSYAAALEAYWRSEELGPHRLAKNAVALVLGLAGSEIQWSRAFTAMPEGNDALEAALSSTVAGTSPDPDELFSRTGPIFTALTGPDGFERVEMAGYAHLYDNVQIGLWARFWIAFISILVASGIWLAATQVNLAWARLDSFTLRRPKAGPSEGERMSETVWNT